MKPGASCGRMPANVSESERAMIEAIAEDLGMSLSDAFRLAIRDLAKRRGIITPTPKKRTAKR